MVYCHMNRELSCALLQQGKSCGTNRTPLQEISQRSKPHLRLQCNPNLLGLSSGLNRNQPVIVNLNITHSDEAAIIQLCRSVQP